MLQPTKFRADVCRHLDREDLIADPRFGSIENIVAYAAVAVEILGSFFATRTLAE